MIRSGARRVLVLVAVLASGSVLIASVFWLASDTGAARSAAVGCYIVGVAAGMIGFVLGLRRVSRPMHGDGGEPVPRSAEEVRESLTVAAVLILSGVVFVLIGAAFDPGATAI